VTVGLREVLEGVGILLVILGFTLKLSRDLGRLETKLLDLVGRVDRLETRCDKRHNGVAK
jgi:hypothetical protein